MDQTQVSCIAGRFFTVWAIWEAQDTKDGFKNNFKFSFIEV